MYFLRFAAGRLNLLKTRKMISPFLIAFARDSRIFQLVNDVLIVIGKALAQKSFDILENERLWHDLADGPYRLRKHISLVLECLVASAQRERLAWRSAYDEIRCAAMLRKIVVTNITLYDPPVADFGYTVRLVPSKRIASIAIPLNRNIMMHSGA